MKRFSVISVFVILTLFLAACGGAGTTEGTPPSGLGGTSEAGGGLGGENTGSTAVAPGAGGAGEVGTPAAGAQATATRQPTAKSTVGAGGTSGGTATRQPTASTSGGTGGATRQPTTGAAGSATRQPTAGTSGGAAGATGQPTTAGTQTGGLVTTPEIPVTGVGNFVRGSQLLKYKVEVMETGAGASGGQSTPRSGATSSGTGAMQTGTPAVGSTVGAGMQTGTPAAGSTSSAGGAGVATQPSGTGGAANQAGTVVGTVNDVILPVMGVSGATQQTAWLVVSVDESFLGLGPNQLIPVPLRNARVDETRQVVILDVTSAMLKEAPSFTSSQWPNLNTAGWEAGFTSYWNNPTAGGATKTGTPAVGATSSVGGTNGGAMQTGTPAVGSTAGAGMQTGTPAAGSTSSAGGAGVATQPSGTGGAAVNANFVRLTELMKFSVQSSAIETDAGGASTTGTPAAGATGTGGTTQNSTPAAGATSSAGGAGSATQSSGGAAGGASSQGALLGTVADVIIDFSGMGASAGSPGNSGGNSGGSSSQVGTPTVVSGAGGSSSSTQQPGTRAGGTSGAPGLNKEAAVVYLVVTADASQGLQSGSNLVAIPWQHIQSIHPDRQVVLVNVSSSQFQKAPAFGANNWPKMTGAGWDMPWSNYWKSK
ncbi:MAG TPA: PRC-barrel domain-containing protein [Anaerolineaceae bacterium]|nr:PRC-barrel domain-containing protein [Anaerolineaceae bacterium]